MGFHLTSLLLSLLLFSALATKSSSQSFKCSTTPTCHSLVGYVSPNATTLSSIKSLFTIKNLRSILGANNLPPSTLPNRNVPPNSTIKIPFSCICSNGTGISNKKPIYKVQEGDALYHIAAEVFSGLTTYQKIAEVNNIPNASSIDVGQGLRIPLPCSCDDVDGKRLVHYGHVVEAGSSLELIAQEYGTTRDALMTLNEIANDNSLMAGQVLNVPLKACNSSVRPDSMDYPLVVANVTYVYTANNCVRCHCDSANRTLQCEPSGLKPSGNWSTCPTAMCPGANNLSLGNSTTSGCTRLTCAYAGYTNQTILTTIARKSICPSETPSSGYGRRISLSWNFLFIPISLILLCVHLI